MPAKFTNNASAPLAASINTSSASITVTTGYGALFPSLAAGEYFYATLTNSSNLIEIVKITARSGDTLTAVRAQEGTTALSWAAADKIELRITAADLANFAQFDSANTFTGANTFSGAVALPAAPTFGGGALVVASGGTGTTTSTGSGSSVLSNSPTLVTPALGTPTSGTLSNCTIDGTNKAGYINIPQNIQNVNYTLVASDAGKHIYHTSGSLHLYTIPSNASVAFPIGTSVTFVNFGVAINIGISTDVLYLGGFGTGGQRTLAQYGVATAIKITATGWVITGIGLT